MKTLKSMLAGIILLFACVGANAGIKPVADKLTKDDVINMYIDAIAHGNTGNLSSILDEGMKFNLQRGENVTSLDKDKFLASVKGNTNDSQVTTTTTILQGDDSQAVEKVEFKYDGYVRTDLITLQNAGGWSITKVDSSFK